MGLTAAEIGRWTPIRVHDADGEPVIDWCQMAGIEFTEPFLDETVQRALRHPFRLLFRHQTPLDGLDALVAGKPGLPIAGIILHVSRCGSTLISQAFGALPEILSLSEPAVLGSALFAAAATTTRAHWFRQLLAALAQPRYPGQRQAIVKLDAWAVLALPIVRAACPGTPIVFIHRDPVEVLVSHQRHRGFHMIPGTLDAGRLGLAPGQRPPTDLDEYGAFVLGRLFAAAVEHLEPHDLVIDHAQLPAAIADAVAPHFAVALDTDARRWIAAAATRDAKNPVLSYDDDRAAKQARADGHLHAVVQRWTLPAVAALQARHA
jgi:hypothetical protein